MKGLKIAVVGATGLVGQELLAILESRSFPVADLALFASPKSQGKPLFWRGQSYLCQALKPGCFAGIDIAFFDASDAVSQEWVPQAAESGAWVIDNSASFRLEDDTLLLVPEVNQNLLEARFKAQKENGEPLSARARILTGPNCVAAPLTVALKPILDQWGLSRVIVSTYQSTSGAGAAARGELAQQASDHLNGKPVSTKIFPHQIAFNCIPHIGKFQPDGSTSEEKKVIDETRKILGLPDLKISVTAVRVPTFATHGESVYVECNQPFEIEAIRAAIAAHPGIILQDDPSQNVYPLGVTTAQDPVEGAGGRDAVYVGRIRKDPCIPQGLSFWLVSDNLRKGAALNAVQMGEVLLKSLG